MTDGLVVVVAWAEWFVLVAALAWFALRRRP